MRREGNHAGVCDWVRDVPGDGSYSVGAGPHGVLPGLHRVRGDRPTTAPRLLDLWRLRAGNVQ
jgi:hypothetical protein